MTDHPKYRFLSSSIPEENRKNRALSVVIPTYNESKNILKMINAVKENLPSGIRSEIVIVDDNSPDGTGTIVEEYIKFTNELKRNTFSQEHKKENNDYDNLNKDYLTKIVHRPNKRGLISAILQGIESSSGQYILIMDADFSHPPEVIPRLLSELLQHPNSIVVASRYTSGGSIVGWPLKRRIISSGAAKLARAGLKIHNVKDPLSGFFAFSRHIIKNITVSTTGYKLLLELLVKSNDGISIREIPYTFTNRRSGQSKLDASVILDYISSVWFLYRYGRKSKLVTKGKEEKRKSVLFFSKAARFFTVGASGLLLNYVISLIVSNGVVSNLWYLQATAIGIIISITSNFFLNKIWTFEDRDFSARHTLKQYGMFAGICSVGATLQLTLLYIFVESRFQFGLSLIFAVGIASASNFLLNKKWTFQEKVWG
jgi:dolichol-phosphate mannosyltransferase